jgi:hypothetical protein
MDKKWTPEPWAASHAWGWINHKDGARAAICVNACAGIEDPAAALSAARDALFDMCSGWMYIRKAHGDLYGVGWQRCEDKAKAALALLTPKGKA